MSDLAQQNKHLSFLEVPSHSSMFVWVNNTKAPFPTRRSGRLFGSPPTSSA
jgi:hypothetical protein